jgi:hypothetical protein
MRYQIRMALMVLGLAPALAEGQRIDAPPAADTLGGRVAPSQAHSSLIERAYGVSAPGALLSLKDRSRLSSDTVKRDSGPSWGRYIGFGFLAGAALGTTAAFLATHASGVTDHSEDGLAYMFFIPTGAAVGAVVGGVLAVTSRWQHHDSLPTR